MKRVGIAAVCMVFVGLLGTARADDKAGPTGTWKWTVTRNNQERTMTLKLKLAEKPYIGTPSASSPPRGAYRSVRSSWRVHDPVYRRARRPRRTQRDTTMKRSRCGLTANHRVTKSASKMAMKSPEEFWYPNRRLPAVFRYPRFGRVR